MAAGKINRKYWDELWSAEDVPPAVDPRDPGLRNCVNRSFHTYFCDAFAGTETAGLKLLEIGCARSGWLPYFAKEFGFKVYGLDYSEKGCDLARSVLARANVQGAIIYADLFCCPADLREAFDVVVSFGVAEHFENTTDCISAFADYLKPGGIMITSIPNIVGVIGMTQKMINRPVYEIHVPLNATDLSHAHKDAGLRVIQSDYFVSTNFGVCNLNGISLKAPGWIARKIIVLLLTRVSHLVWGLESAISPLPATRLFSPYINCTARKM